jgi:23S rRNA (pseudouridine1915-N3)-methyltransferase
VKLTIVAIGRAGRGPERDLYEHYARRIRWPLTLRELEEKRKLPAAEMIKREGELLLAAVPQKAVMVALDRRGKVLDSEAFAGRLRRRPRRAAARTGNAGGLLRRHDVAASSRSGDAGRADLPRPAASGRAPLPSGVN